MPDDKSKRVRIEAPEDMDALEVAHALLHHVTSVLGEQKRKKDKRRETAAARDNTFEKPPSRTFSRHPAMEGLHEEVVRAYDAQLKRMVARILRYITVQIVPGMELKKSDSMYGFVSGIEWPDDGLIAKQSDDAESPFLDTPSTFGQMPALTLLTPAQMERVKQIIRDHHAGFAVGVLGPDSIPPEEVQRLIDAGVIPQDLKFVFQPAPGELPPESMNFTDMAYRYGGEAAQPQQRNEVMQMALSEFVESLDQSVDLSVREQQAMAWARHNAGEHIRGIGDKIGAEVSSMVRDADAELRRKYVGVVREQTEENIERREQWRDLASRIGHKTGDWSRDLQRMAATEKQWAMQEGAATSIAKRRKEEPKDIVVAKQPNPDACPDCVRLHLTAGPGSAPRKFKLSELQANGTNVGKKRAGWQAVVGPVHPWCGCELIEIPDGWDFDETGVLMPEPLLDKSMRLDVSLMKAVKTEEDIRPHMTHRDAVPSDTCVVRIGDPQMRAVVEAVVAAAPPEIFAKDVGVTLITTDTPRAQNPLDEHDFAYWTANEIRIMQTLPIERVPRVIRHELGHSLNVYLMQKLGSVDKVRAWHDDLWKVSLEEGFVSDYATKLPIENAAEVTRMYIFERHQLMLRHARQFAFCHRAYRAIFRKKRP